MRRLGVDPGQRRVGLSVSDESAQLASPHATLPGGDAREVAARIDEEVRRLEVGEVVIGLPLLMNGQEGPAARKARALKAALEERLDNVPVVLWDERLTTVSAERQLRASGVSARKQRGVIDQVAATLLLQGYLDGLAARGEEP